MTNKEAQPKTIYNDLGLYKKKMGELLKRRRKELGHNQSDVGKMIGLSQTSMSEFENGGNPTLDHYINYCNAVNYDFAALVAKARVMAKAELEALEIDEQMGF